MNRFIEGVGRSQVTLFPDRLEDWIGDDHPVRVIDAFVDALDLNGLGFERATAAATGRPGYHPSVLLKLHIYGYLNRVQSSRRLEREAGRNVEVMWLTGRLVPDHKTIADFRKDNGAAAPQGLRAVRRAVPSDRPSVGRQRRHRRLEVQGGEQPGPELHQGQDGATHEADRRERCRVICTSSTAPIGKSRLRRFHVTGRVGCKEKIGRLGEEMQRLRRCWRRSDDGDAPDEQISSDRSGCTLDGDQLAGGSGVVGYNVQAAVETGSSPDRRP